MADVKVKLFGVFRMDTHIPEITIRAETVGDIFPVLNEKSQLRYEENKKVDPNLEPPSKFQFKDAIVYINGERCSRKSRKLTDSDELWLLSPASGG